MKHVGLKLRMAVVAAILAAFYLVVVAVAVAAFGPGIWPVAVAGTVLLVGVQYKIGKWAALRSVGAEDLPEEQYPRVHQQVRRLSRDMGIEEPRLMGARMGVPNAFAVGRKGAGVVVVSTELMQLLDDDELEGVLAHELAHIANRDVVTMVVGQGIASIVGIAAQFAVLATGDNDLADFFLAVVVGNVVQFVVMLFVLAISRYREYVADADAREAIGSGEPLARALEKISGGHERARESAVDDQVSALCIFGDADSVLTRLVSTHPPTEERIERLRA
ncbi:M48 family metalloprotease [Halomicroarcula sp. S3CR25-11]|uniref:M48 family metalloprotease n=2 Tax=Haloarcula onubensis TaxID=2950539 RepID=A0ABU2FUZ2_9EURY|nr:M48 family metalloprotease [Halomicroarcula sp. S3CR25-11]MDS0284568.1 M48 family metalloprotease [Halomicroarcula sp. S3CR25-11]